MPWLAVGWYLVLADFAPGLLEWGWGWGWGYGKRSDLEGNRTAPAMGCTVRALRLAILINTEKCGPISMGLGRRLREGFSGLYRYRGELCYGASR